MWLWLHLISWAVLAVAAGIALFSRTRQFVMWTMIARVCYLVSIKILIAIGLIGLLEMAFADKKQQHLSKIIIWSAIAAFVLVTVVGFALAQFRPFI